MGNGRRNFRALCAGLAMVAALAVPGLAGAMDAADLPPLTGEVLLRVTGLDESRFPDGKLEFDRARLLALGEASFDTTTIWTTGMHHFAGPSLKSLTEVLGLDSGTLSAMAVNDYAVDVPVSDATDPGPILALSLDGMELTPRDRGPVWLVYPYDMSASYQTEVIFSRSIWQLNWIEVHP